MNKKKDSHFAKIRLSPLDLPYIETTDREKAPHKVVYGVSRGWQAYDSLQDAEAELARFVASQIHSHARKLDALCNLQRKLSGGAA